jgi:outer membrane protein assembly factor BamA
MQRMKRRVIVFLCCLLHGSVILFGQTSATIEKTEISGISEDMLSSGLRGDLQKLTGQSYDEKVASQFAERIQSELPEYVVTPTTSPGEQPERLRLVFVVAHNVNARYIVEAVELKGTDKSKLSEPLWTELQNMVGHPVDDAEADRLRDRIGDELKYHHIRRSVVRGNQPQHVRLVYEKPNDNSIGFDASGGYHSRQKFSGRLGVQYTKWDLTGIRIDAYNDSNLLIERYAGPRYGYWIGYKRVRFNINYSSFRAQWSPGTLEAASQSVSDPGLYRLRDTIEPTVKVTITPAIHATFGVTSSLLQLQSPVLHFETVRAATGNLEYSFYTSSSERHQFSGNYELHVAGDTLDSAQSYTRHLWNQGYSLKGGKTSSSKGGNTGSVQSSFSWDRVGIDLELGRITGSAPMYDRFSLGNSNKLLGWNKYEIAPLGASRVAYGSINVGNKYGTVFFESGSLWDDGQPQVLRNSVGMNLMPGNLIHGPAWLSFILNLVHPGIGIPLRSSNVHPVFTFGGSS